MQIYSRYIDSSGENLSLDKPGKRALTCFERLDGDRGGVVPQSLPDLSELPVAETSLELEAAPLDLPLIPSIVREVSRRRFVDLRRH